LPRVCSSPAFSGVYNLSRDPGESNNLTVSALENQWVTAPVAEILRRFEMSEARYPNVELGEDFQGYGAK
jgi:hypothetical protein